MRSGLRQRLTATLRTQPLCPLRSLSKTSQPILMLWRFFPFRVYLTEFFGAFVLGMSLLRFARRQQLRKLQEPLPLGSPNTCTAVRCRVDRNRPAAAE